MQGRLDDARRVLTRTTGGPDEAELRLQEIKESLGEHAKLRRGEGVWRELLVRPTPSVRRILLAALGLQFFQQASGIDSVVLYSPRVFQKAGIRSDSNSLGATVAVGFTKTAFILVATFFLDRVGRRPLLLASAGGMVASLLALASTLHVIGDRAHDHSDGHRGAAAAVAIAAVLSFVGSFSIGLGRSRGCTARRYSRCGCGRRGPAWGGREPGHKWGNNHDLHLALQRHHHLRELLPLRGGRGGGVGVLLRLLAGDAGRSLEDMEVLFGKKRVEEEKEKEEGVVENTGDPEGESQENKC
uniref:Major facilitator superfamily (MFS) profile domain-containing protein n=1 Tax=Ananas comosus var. bracteatus TaxID=296719 RepID=A0A6V7NVM8_ANACO|nr:unnamed protein product [Ananas comosus var. bracteatus]